MLFFLYRCECDEGCGRTDAGREEGAGGNYGDRSFVAKSKQSGLCFLKIVKSRETEVRGCSFQMWQIRMCYWLLSVVMREFEVSREEGMDDNSILGVLVASWLSCHSHFRCRDSKRGAGRVLRVQTGCLNY